MSALTLALRRLRPRPAAEPVSSSTSFEQVTRERVDSLRDQVNRIELKLNGVLLAAVGAAVAEIYRAASR